MPTPQEEQLSSALLCSCSSDGTCQGRRDFPRTPFLPSFQHCPHCRCVPQPPLTNTAAPNPNGMGSGSPDVSLQLPGQREGHKAVKWPRDSPRFLADNRLSQLSVTQPLLQLAEASPPEDSLPPMKTVQTQIMRFPNKTG